MKKYPFILRLLVVFPVITLMGIVWGLIGIFSIKSLGSVLKKTGENLLEVSDNETWEYGTVEGSVFDRRFLYTNTRRHKRKGNVQFILHEAGRQGHKEDYWYNLDSYYWNYFKPSCK